MLKLNTSLKKKKKLEKYFKPVTNREEKLTNLFPFPPTQIRPVQVVCVSYEMFIPKVSKSTKVSKNLRKKPGL